MPKSLGKELSPEVSHGDRTQLQQQLNDLKAKSLRTLRLTRTTDGNVKGLIDSLRMTPGARLDGGHHVERIVPGTLLRRIRICPLAARSARV